MAFTFSVLKWRFRFSGFNSCSRLARGCGITDPEGRRNVCGVPANLVPGPPPGGQTRPSGSRPCEAVTLAGLLTRHCAMAVTYHATGDLHRDSGRQGYFV